MLTVGCGGLLPRKNEIHCSSEVQISRPAAVNGRTVSVSAHAQQLAKKKEFGRIRSVSQSDLSIYFAFLHGTNSWCYIPLLYQGLRPRRPALAALTLRWSVLVLVFLIVVSPCGSNGHGTASDPSHTTSHSHQCSRNWFETIHYHEITVAICQ